MAVSCKLVLTEQSVSFIDEFLSNFCLILLSEFTWQTLYVPNAFIGSNSHPQKAKIQCALTMCACLVIFVFSYVVGSGQRGDRGGWGVLLRAGDGHGGVCAVGRHRVPLLLLRPHTTTEHTGLLLRHRLLGRWNCRTQVKSGSYSLSKLFTVDITIYT